MSGGNFMEVNFVVKYVGLCGNRQEHRFHPNIRHTSFMIKNMCDEIGEFTNPCVLELDWTLTSDVFTYLNVYLQNSSTANNPEEWGLTNAADYCLFLNDLLLVADFLDIPDVVEKTADAVVQVVDTLNGPLLVRHAFQIPTQWTPEEESSFQQERQWMMST
jgi:hypothetical protein